MAKIYYFCGTEQYQPEVLVKHAQLAEEAGFDGIMISEHFQPWVADDSAASFAFATLGAIAQSTSKIELSMGVICPLFRMHPAVIAQASATIDRLSQGRFILGVGMGEAINEEALGYIIPPYKERSARMIESLEIMERLLRGEKVSYDGTYYKTSDAKLYSPPLHPIPIFLAAGGEKSATIAAKYADGVITSVKKIEDTQSLVIGPYRKIQKQNPHVIATQWSVFASSKEEAYEALKPWRGLRVPSKETAHDPEVLQDEADVMPQDDVLSRYPMIRTAEGFVDLYTPLITELHADVVVIQSVTNKNQEELIHMLGTTVVPELKAKA